LVTGGNYDPVTALGSDLIEMWDAARGDKIATLTDSTYTNAVSSWKGLVLNSDLAMSTPLLKPWYSPAGLAGGPCLTFDGVQQYLTCTDAALLAALPDGAEAGEMWILLSQDTLVADTTERYACGWAGSSVVAGRAISRVVTGGVNRARGRTGIGASAASADDTAVDFSGVHVIRQIVGATQSSLSVDGGTLNSVAAVPATTNTRFRVGAIPAAGATNHLKCKIGVVLVTRTLSADKAAALHHYLG
jgi:hypothetical protein